MEFFIRIAYLNNCHVFIHTLYDPKYTRVDITNMCGQIYNTLISQEKIADGDVVIVYDLGETIDCHIAQHASFPDRFFDHTSLAQLLFEIVCFPEIPETSLIITTDAQKYELYDAVENKQAIEAFKIGGRKIRPVISNIYNVITMKIRPI